MEQVLVTGGTGFIGQALVRALRRQGIPVRVLARPATFAAKPAVVIGLQRLGAELAIGDVLDGEAVLAAARGVTHVFHLAGRLLEPGVPEGEYVRLHVEGTRNVLLACAQAPNLKRVVHVSTAGVLGPTGARPSTEDAPPRPTTVYEASKAVGEQVAQEMAREFRLSLAITRPGLVYGPGDYHLLGWFRAIRNGYYRVVGSGHNLVHPIFVSDVVSALLRCALGRTAGGQTYHLVGDRRLTMREMAEAIARANGRTLPRGRIPQRLAVGVAAALEAIPGVPPAALPLTRSRISFMTESRVYCGCRIERDLGFRPRVGLPEGLQRTVDWYQRHKLV